MTRDESRRRHPSYVGLSMRELGELKAIERRVLEENEKRLLINLLTGECRLEAQAKLLEYVEEVRAGAHCEMVGKNRFVGYIEGVGQDTPFWMGHVTQAFGMLGIAVLKDGLYPPVMVDTPIRDTIRRNLINLMSS